MAGKKAGAAGREDAPPVVLLLGGDAPKIEAEVERLKAASLGPSGSADVDAASFHVGDAPIRQILDDARAVPFLSAKRFVLVRHLDRPRNQHGLTKEDLETIDEYCDSPSPQSCVVFTAAKLPENQRPFTTLSRKAHLTRCEDIGEREGVESFVAREMAARGLRDGADAARTVSERFGRDPARIRNELDKWTAYLGGRADVTRDDLAALLPDLAVQQDVWELTNAVSERNLGEALARFRKALSAGSAPYALTGMIANTLRQTLAARRALDAGGGRSEVSAAIGSASPFFVERVSAAARRFRTVELERLTRELARADRRMKSGAPPDAALEEVFWSLREDAPAPDAR